MCKLKAFLIAKPPFTKPPFTKPPFVNSRLDLASRLTSVFSTAPAARASWCGEQAEHLPSCALSKAVARHVCL